MEVTRNTGIPKTTSYFLSFIVIWKEKLGKKIETF